MQRGHYTHRIQETTVERVSSFRPRSEDLTWTNHISTLVKETKQPLYFLKRLRKSPSPQCCYEPSTPKPWGTSLTGRITTAQSSAQNNQMYSACYARLHSPACMGTRWSTTRARLFRWLLSDKRCHPCMARNERLRRSFCSQSTRTPKSAPSHNNQPPPFVLTRYVNMHSLNEQSSKSASLQNLSFLYLRAAEEI